MAVVSEGLGQADPAHDGERDVVDQPSQTRLASSVSLPGGDPVGLGRLDEPAPGFEPLTKLEDVASERRPCCGVPTFGKDVRCRHDRDMTGKDSRKGLRSGFMPLVVSIPDRDQTDRVEKRRAQGWCSSWRAARS
jgi:hypothetical protein